MADLQTRELRMTYYASDKDGVIIYAEDWSQRNIEYKIRLSWQELKSINFIGLSSKQYHDK